jgi:hypothetical protein
MTVDPVQTAPLQLSMVSIPSPSFLRDKSATR